MSKIVIHGGRRLSGEVTMQGAKNSALPLLAATVLADQPCVLNHCPALSDVETSIEILEGLGAKVTRQNGSLRVDPCAICSHEVSAELMRKMRSSIVFLGAITGRMGKALLSYPGGCELGPRPIDFHLAALRKMGAVIDDVGGFIRCETPNGLTGAQIVLPKPSVGATENIMMAAVRARGKTVIQNAASEPEVIDLADFLNRCGAQITGAGSVKIEITGVERLAGAVHDVIPDRIAAATYLVAAAITGGEIILSGARCDHMEAILPCFEEMGCALTCGQSSIKLAAPQRLRRIYNIETGAYPAFPTDAQPLFMAMTAVADGVSVFSERIFDGRYGCAGELQVLGAKINLNGPTAVVEGVYPLSGAPVQATDLRGGAALVLAGLCAQGITEISGVNHLDRGYERLEETLASLGASIERVE